MMTDEARPKAGPVTFRDILGQERPLRYLAAARLKGRLAHAYLFLGPEGVGKAATARALAAALNCESLREDGDACGQCHSCRRLAAGTHPDFLEIYPTSRERPPKIKIDQIRELRRLTAYAPLGGGWRVVLIKPAEDLKPEAANALLKTLEEPPEQHLLVLTAGVEDDLFPTVVSRCQKLAFTPLPISLIRGELVRRGAEPAQAGLLAALSGGSLARALTLKYDEVVEQRRRVLADLEHLSRGGTAHLLDWAQRLAKDPEATDAFLGLAALWHRDLILLAQGAPADLLANRDCLPEIEAACRRERPAVWFRRFTAIAAAQRHLRANLNPELTLDVLGLHLRGGPTP